MERLQILLTNDDGIRSPGLWAAALASLGRVTVAAPKEQSSGMGRSLPGTSSGIIHEEKLQVNGQDWTVYAVGGSPAQAVLHGVLEIMPQNPIWSFRESTMARTSDSPVMLESDSCVRRKEVHCETVLFFSHSHID